MQLYYAVGKAGRWCTTISPGSCGLTLQFSYNISVRLQDILLLPLFFRVSPSTLHSVKQTFQPFDLRLTSRDERAKVIQWYNYSELHFFFQAKSKLTISFITKVMIYCKNKIKWNFLSFLCPGSTDRQLPLPPPLIRTRGYAHKHTQNLHLSTISFLTHTG